MRKLANRVNGLELSDRRVGDVFELSERDARMLIAEGWAVAAIADPAPPSKTPPPKIPKRSR